MMQMNKKYDQWETNKKTENILESQESEGV